jgi:pyruvate ferredoxin oxidoreductase gamma subunit
VAVVKMDSLIEPIKERFERIAEKNINAVKRAFAETKVKE